MASHPPRLCRWLVTFGVSADRREEVVGDLEEHFRRRRREEGLQRARLWYLQQVAAFALVGFESRVMAVLNRGWRAARGGCFGVIQDVRFTARGFRRAPVFSLVIVVTLALGIGGTTAVFSVVDGVLLRSLPVHDPDRLVAVLDTAQGGRWWSAAPANVVAWREHARTVTGVAWAQAGRGSLLVDGEVREVKTQRVSANLLDVLGVHPGIGRGFTAPEELAGGPAVTILTHEFWQRLGGDRSMVGDVLVLDEILHTVIGILPAGWSATFLSPHALLVPRLFTEEELRSPGRLLQTVARIAPGATMERARAELERIMISRDPVSGWGVEVVPLREQLVGDVRSKLLVLSGAVLFVLLVACVNVGNLLLARGSVRVEEFALRAALGASRGRIARQLLTEVSVLGLVGGAAGVMLAMWGVDSLLAVYPDALPRTAEVGVRPRVLGVALGLSGLAVILAGLAPAIRDAGHAGRVRLRARSDTAVGRGGVRSSFVAVQVAAVLVLLAGAGLMLRSFDRLRSVDPGFPTADRLVLEISLPETSYPDPQSVSRFFRGVVERVRSVPGVLEAGVVSHPPLFGDDWSTFHVVESGPPVRPGEEPVGGMEAAGPGYFEAMGIPLLEGRTFRPGDGREGPPIVIVDEAMRAKYWPDRSPIGDRVRMSRVGALADWHEVVGVVGAVRYHPASGPRARLYLPDDRLPFHASTWYVIVRTASGRELAVVGRLRSEVREMAPTVALGALRSLDQAYHSSLAPDRLQTLLLGVFGGIALVLGAIGVYGLVSYQVGRRTREVGLRMALGAGGKEVLREVLARALRPVLTGVSVGITVTLFLGRFLRDMLFEVHPNNPMVVAAVSALLLLVAVLSAIGPSVRATRIDPVCALRGQ